MRFIDTETEVVSNVNEEALGQDAHGPRVLCLGLYRTGTSSLQAALDLLGYSPCYHAAYLMPDISRIKIFCACARENDPRIRQKLLAKIFDQYNAATDVPTSIFVEDLIEMYPAAKLILNKRSSADDWSESCKTSLAFYATKLYGIIGWWVPLTFWHHQIYVAISHVFQYRFQIDRSAIFDPKLYRLHNDWIRAIAKKEGKDLLEWEVGKDGWKSLCSYLDKEEPKDNLGNVLSFPRVNERKAMQELRHTLVWKGLRVWVFVIVLALLPVWALAKSKGVFLATLA